MASANQQGSNLISRLNSRIENMRALSPDDRRKAVCREANLSSQDETALAGSDTLPMTIANGMIENVIGKFELPLGVATNFVINSKDYLIPMAVEEPSVVAAASYMAKIARDWGGFKTSSTAPIMRAQVQILGVSDPHGARQRLLAAREEIMVLANSRDQILIDLGGGCKDIEVHIFEDTPIGVMVVLHLLVDVRDAMGANTVNTMAEMVAPRVSEISGGEVRLRILSNLADRRIVRAKVEIPAKALTTKEFSGEEIARRIVEACALLWSTPIVQPPTIKEL